ncbi:MAG: copper oxidase, partial [Planctomycetota bacterium]
MLDGNEIVHSDINAIISGWTTPYPPNPAYPDRNDPFREFTVIFHDEAFAVQAFPSFYKDPVLGHTLTGVRDAFPINYGSGGIGSEIIANRIGVGPMWDCAECKYEEFFLTSNTVGDPAMIVDIPANADGVTGPADGIPDTGPKATMALFPDDPSNVHHAYLGDNVKFRNLHAGPKEHHVFHLHAHQWLFTPNERESSYLDGQAIGPGSGYTYEIAYGGSGNRNLTPGDSIFHCHFYPHFAMGMWELWRVHDVFEQGTELDQAAVALNPAAGRPAPGARALPDGEIAVGTPIPGVVPMPGLAMPVMPDQSAGIVQSDLDGDPLTFTGALGMDSSQFDANGDGFADIDQVNDPNAAVVDLGQPTERALTNPGYPFYIPGLMGHRPPTPALDILDDGGLPRHVVTSGPDEFGGPGVAVEQYQTRLDFNKILHEAAAVEIPEAGTAVELVAQAFHATPSHPSFKPDGSPAPFVTNGLPAVAGAPFADPCRTDSGGPISQNRTIKGANIEMDIKINKVGWHFPQQRFEALWDDVIPTLNGDRAPEPLVMRLNSTDCAEFHHTNLVPNVYQLDDYQVRTPTDIIGQHIHLVKFDVTSADGAANGFNYEDGTLSPDEVRERIEAFNHGGGFLQTDGTVRSTANGNELTPEDHPVFGGIGPQGQDWRGARTTIQRWYAD